MFFQKEIFNLGIVFLGVLIISAFNFFGAPFEQETPDRERNQQTNKIREDSKNIINGQEDLSEGDPKSQNYLEREKQTKKISAEAIPSFVLDLGITPKRDTTNNYLENIFEKEQSDNTAPASCASCENGTSNDPIDKNCQREMDKILAETPYDKWEPFRNSEIYKETMASYFNSLEDAQEPSVLERVSSVFCSITDNLSTGFGIIETARAGLGCSCGSCCDSDGCHCIPPCCCACCPACCGG